MSTSHSAHDIQDITRDHYGPDAIAHSDHHGGITIDADGLHASVPRQRSRVLAHLTSDYDDDRTPEASPATGGT